MITDQIEFLRRLSKYNFKEDDEVLWERYLAANGLCEICHENEVTSFDHCHTTNYFRGFLCANCNFGLGFFKDRIRLLANAIIYLEDHRHVDADEEHATANKPNVQDWLAE